MEMFKKYQVQKDQLEECPRAKQVRQNESQANSLVQLHKMTAYLGHVDWIVEALKHEQNIAVGKRRRVGRDVEKFRKARAGVCLQVHLGKLGPRQQSGVQDREQVKSGIMSLHVKTLLKTTTVHLAHEFMKHEAASRCRPLESKQTSFEATSIKLHATATEG